MSKFTPGKWIYDGVAFIEAEDNRRLAMIYSCNVPEWQANARLLSNAQAMYEFIKTVSNDETYALSICAKELLKRIDGLEEQS